MDLGEELRVVLEVVVRLLDLAEGLGEGLGDELPAEPTEALLRVALGDGVVVAGGLAEGGGLIRGVVCLLESGAEVGDDLLHGRGAFFGGGVLPGGLDGLENRGADHNAVADVGHVLDHRGVGDPEPDREGKFRLGPDARDEILQIRGKLRAGARDAGDGDAVQERRCALGEVFDALVRTGGGDERDVGQIVLLAGGRELDALLGWKVHDDEPVGSGLRGFGAELLDSVLEEGVVVSHEDDGDGKALLTGLLDHLEALGDLGGAALDGNLVGVLDGGAVGLGVGVGDSKLND
mmetsp:Transcript_21358/g.43101  ORF Transcript_21358/g.43101 Transcript_21358/m.43101 type:complete len:292 (+) Transcript_21358:1229-2104(+)